MKKSLVQLAFNIFSLGTVGTRNPTGSVTNTHTGFLSLKFTKKLGNQISTCKLGIDSYEPYQSCTSLFQLGIGKSTSCERFVWKTQSIHYKPKYHSAFQNLYRRKPRKVGYFVRCLYCPSKKWAAMAASLRPHDLNEELWLKLLYPSKNLKWYTTNF